MPDRVLIRNRKTILSQWELNRLEFSLVDCNEFATIYVAVGRRIASFRSMLRRLLILAAGLAAGLPWGLVEPGSARAACTDPPGPKVNWQRCRFDGLDLKGVELTSARLRDGSFFRADLTGSDLSKTSAFRAKFVNAILRNAKLDGAKLSEADFGGTPCRSKEAPDVEESTGIDAHPAIPL